MFLISWNVAGWSTTAQAIRESYGSIEAFFRMTQADIICLQESKVSQAKLGRDPVGVGAADPNDPPSARQRGTPSSSSSSGRAGVAPVRFSSPYAACDAASGALKTVDVDPTAAARGACSHSCASGSGIPSRSSGGIPGWESYWAHSAPHLRGMNGVVTFVRSRCTLACDNRPFDEEELNEEGRCLVTYHSSVIVVNVYVPNARGGTRMAAKMKFLKALEGLLHRLRRGEGCIPAEKNTEPGGATPSAVREAVRTPRPVILAGDFNVTYRSEDAAWWFRRVELKRLVELLEGAEADDEPKGESQGGQQQQQQQQQRQRLYVDPAALRYFCHCVRHLLCHRVSAALELLREHQQDEASPAARPLTGVPPAEDRPMPRGRSSATTTTTGTGTPSAAVVQPSIAVDTPPLTAVSSTLLPLVDPLSLRADRLAALAAALDKASYLSLSPDPLLPFPPGHYGSSTPCASASASSSAPARPPLPLPPLPPHVMAVPVSLRDLLEAGFTCVCGSDFLQGNTAAATFNPYDTRWNREVVYPILQLAGLPPHADDTIHFMSRLLQAPFPAGTAPPAAQQEGGGVTQRDRMWDSFLITPQDQEQHPQKSQLGRSAATTSTVCPYAPCPFTCWDQQRNRRHTNEGTRLDYILVDDALLSHVVCRAETENNTGPLPLARPAAPLTEEDWWFWGEYSGGARRADGIRRAVAGGAYPPAPYDGSGLPPLDLGAREWNWRGLPSTGLFVTPPQFSDHIGVCLLLRDALDGAGNPTGLSLRLEPRSSGVNDLHPPCAFLPQKNLFAFMAMTPQKSASAAAAPSRESTGGEAQPGAAQQSPPPRPKEAKSLSFIHRKRSRGTLEPEPIRGKQREGESVIVVDED